MTLVRVDVVGGVLPPELAAQPVDQRLDAEAVVVTAHEVLSKRGQAVHHVVLRVVAVGGPGLLHVVLADHDAVPAEQVGMDESVGYTSENSVPSNRMCVDIFAVTRKLKEKLDGVISVIVTYFLQI